MIAYIEKGNIVVKDNGIIKIVKDDGIGSNRTRLGDAIASIVPCEKWASFFYFSPDRWGHGERVEVVVFGDEHDWYDINLPPMKMVGSDNRRRVAQCNIEGVRVGTLVPTTRNLGDSSDGNRKEMEFVEDFCGTYYTWDNIPDNIPVTTIAANCPPAVRAKIEAVMRNRKLGK
jgi:hypothetical protein